jgi:hypothetical protein
MFTKVLILRIYAQRGVLGPRTVNRRILVRAIRVARESGNFIYAV